MILYWAAGLGNELHQVIDVLNGHRGDGVNLYLAETSHKYLRQAIDIFSDRQGDKVNLYLAEGSSMHLETVSQVLKSPNFLMSYHYFNTLDFNKWLETLPIRPNLFLDSGAWSAYTQGVDVSIDQYAAFVLKNKKAFTVYCNLDDMNNPDQTVKNQHYLESKGLEPLPVFHTGEDWSYLEYYAERYPYVCLGKIIPYTTNSDVIMPWLAKCFRIGNGKCVFHGLGVTNWKLMNSFPFYSVDSSSWGSGYRFGRVSLFDKNVGKMFSFSLNDRKEIEKNRKLIERYGYKPTQFYNADGSPVKGKHLAEISALSYVNVQQYITKRFGERTLQSNVYK